MSWCRAHSGTYDQILLPVGTLLSENCVLVSVEHPLWRVDGSAVSSAITQWFQSLRTRNHTLLPHLRLPPNLKGQVPVFISPRKRGPSYTPGTGFPLHRLLRLAGLQWLLLLALFVAGTCLPSRCLATKRVIYFTELLLNKGGIHTGTDGRDL
jgi:hypothetical protein